MKTLTCLAVLCAMAFAASVRAGQFEETRAKAEKGDAEAQSNLACYYIYGWEGVTKDPLEATKWYRKAAEQWLKAAEQGDINAQSRMGYCYAKGQGVTKNEAEARKWYGRALEQHRKAAEQGDIKAQNWLGDRYAYGGNSFGGIDGSKDPVEAAKWWRKAAEQGNASAQTNLGNCYFYGLGVPKNEAEAAKWYHKAREQGNTNEQRFKAAQAAQQQAQAQANMPLPNVANEQAQNTLAQANALQVQKANTQRLKQAPKKLCDEGFSYFNGQGVPKNYDKAFGCFSQAAQQGNADAQFYLGVCYAEGKGVTKSLIQAYRWFNQSAAQGDTTAASYRETIESQMKPDEIRVAQTPQNQK